MAHFTGSQAVDIEDTVLGLLKNYLAGKLAAAPYQTKFQRWGGPGVSIDPDKDFGANARGVSDAFSRKPWIYLEIVDREPDAAYYDGTRHRIELSAEVLTADACLPAERPLKTALMAIVTDGYHELWDIGLEEISIRAGQGSNPRPNRLNPHTITLVAYSRPS